MYASILWRFFVFFYGLVTEILKQVIDGFKRRRYEIDRISIRKALSPNLESLNMIQVNLVNVEEFAARREHSECCLVQDHYQIVFALSMPPCIFDHIIQNAMLCVTPQCVEYLH